MSKNKIFDVTTDFFNAKKEEPAPEIIIEPVPEVIPEPTPELIIEPEVVSEVPMVSMEEKIMQEIADIRKRNENLIVEQPIAEQPIAEQPIAEQPIIEAIVPKSLPVVEKKRYLIFNKSSQHIHFSNGEIIEERSKLVVESVTNQMLTLEKRGIISIKEM